MPSNYTIAKTLQRIAYYREICGRDPGRFAPTAMEVQGMVGRRLDALEAPTVAGLEEMLSEADTEAAESVLQIIQGAEITALRPDVVPLSILEITEIKGIGAKMAKRAHDELGIVDLSGLKAALDDGRLAKVKGFGPKVGEKIAAHVAKEQKEAK